MTNRNWLDWVPSPENLPACPENELTKPTKSISVGSYQGEDHHSSADGVPQGGTDKTDKSLTAEQAEALRLLNLAGVRIMRYDSEARLGVWEDLDGPELRAAIASVGMDELRVLYLESAEVPIRFKIRSCPDRNAGESFEAWRQRVLRETPQPTHKST